MTRSIVGLFMFAVALLSVHSAWADQGERRPTVRGLLRGCALAGVPRQPSAAAKITDEEFNRLLDAMECVGVFAAVEELDPMLPANMRSCIPPTVSLGQQIRSFLAEATRLDAVALDGDAAIVIAAVLRHTWPCPAL